MPAHAAVDVGVGLVGVAGGNFLDKTDSTPPGVPYPGYGGLTLGGGLMLDARFLDGFLGVEADIIRSSDKGKGDVTVNGFTFHHTIGQSAWHVPLLAKLAIPSPVVSPMFFLGPELVFPSGGESTLDPDYGGNPFRAKADNYVMITGGAGIEIKLPVPIVDLRIPLGLRLSYNPSVPSRFQDRVTADLATGTATLKSEWKYAVNLSLGAAIYF